MRKSIAALGVVVAFMAAACESTEPELVESSDQGGSADTADDASGDDAEEKSNGNKSFKIGDTVAMGDVEHVLHGARWSEGDEYFGPEDGERWLVLDIGLKNNGDESASISSLLMWSLVDSQSRTADLALTADEQGSLDGELGAGRELRGEIAFVVTDEGPWELLFEPEVFGTGQAIYKIKPGEVKGG